jgi:hypothetical protein
MTRTGAIVLRTVDASSPAARRRSTNSWMSRWRISERRAPPSSGRARSRSACWYPRTTDGLYGCPLRFVIFPSRAPATHSPAASRRVRREGGASVPVRRATSASARQAFAAARVGNVFRSFFPSRREKTDASQLERHDEALERLFELAVLLADTMGRGLADRGLSRARCTRRCGSRRHSRSAGDPWAGRRGPQGGRPALPGARRPARRTGVRHRSASGGASPQTSR